MRHLVLQSEKTETRCCAVLGTFGMHNRWGLSSRPTVAGYAMLGQGHRRTRTVSIPRSPPACPRCSTAGAAYDAPRAEKMQAELKAIADKKGLSPDVEEIVKAVLRLKGRVEPSAKANRRSGYPPTVIASSWPPEDRY